MPEFRITEERTVTQERTFLVEAANLAAAERGDSEELTVLSDWETVRADSDYSNVEER